MTLDNMHISPYSPSTSLMYGTLQLCDILRIMYTL